MYFCENCGNQHNGSYGSGRFCCSKCARSFSTKNKRLEINVKVSSKLKNRYKNTSPRYCPVCGKLLPLGTRISRKTCSQNCSKIYKSQLSKAFYSKNKDILIKNGFKGGYRKGSSKGKSGYYKGIWCDSSYELVYLIYNLDHGNDIIRNTDKFPYVYNCKKHFYYPDFRVNNKLVEIKNFWTELVQVKLDCVPEDISILYFDDIEYMMDYVDEKYGTYHKGKSNNYETLYDS